MLAYNVETRQYYSVAPSQGYDEKVAEEQDEEGLSEVQIFLACQIRKSGAGCSKLTMSLKL